MTAESSCSRVETSLVIKVNEKIVLELLFQKKTLLLEKEPGGNPTKLFFFVNVIFYPFCCY